MSMSILKTKSGNSECNSKSTIESNMFLNGVEILKTCGTHPGSLSNWAWAKKKVPS